jgi:hypothetical protein
MLEEKYTEMIPDWLEGRLIGLDFEDFERERRDNPVLEEQCRIAAALREHGRRERKAAFLAKMADIEANLKAGQESASTSTPPETAVVNMPFSEKIKTIERDLAAEGFPIRQKKNNWTGVIRRAVLLRAAVLVGLLVLAYQLVKIPFLTKDTTFDFAQAQKPSAPQPAFEQLGYAQTDVAIDSLLVKRAYPDALKLLQQIPTDSQSAEQRFKTAFCLIMLARTPDEARPAVTALERLDATKDAFPRSEYYVPTYLALGYLQTNQREKAIPVLEKLAATDAPTYQTFARNLLKQLSK